MGKVYLVKGDELEQHPAVRGDGAGRPIAGAHGAGLCSERLRRHNGQIKNILINQRFIAGIGNAYADEILYAARIHPYRKRSDAFRRGGEHASTVPCAQFWSGPSPRSKSG